MLKNKERVVVLIDGPNLTATLAALDLRIDFDLLVDSLELRNSIIVGVHWYSAVFFERDGVAKIMPFLDRLAHQGFILHTKQAKKIGDTMKGNMDVELSWDMRELCDHIDHIVLFSGDGDFKYAVERAQLRGKYVTVVSSVRTQPYPMVDNELRKKANKFVDIADLSVCFVSRPSRLWS